MTSKSNSPPICFRSSLSTFGNLVITISLPSEVGASTSKLIHGFIAKPSAPSPPSCPSQTFFYQLKEVCAHRIKAATERSLSIKQLTLLAWLRFTGGKSEKVWLQIPEKLLKSPHPLCQWATKILFFCFFLSSNFHSVSHLTEMLISDHLAGLILNSQINSISFESWLNQFYLKHGKRRSTWTCK